MNSASRCGRSLSSKDESSSTGAAETTRSRLGSGLEPVAVTVPDSRTKCEDVQLLFAVSMDKLCGIAKNSLDRDVKRALHYEVSSMLDLENLHGRQPQTLLQGIWHLNE